MADLDDSVLLCEDCMNPVEGSSRCPGCGGRLFPCDPLAVQILRFLFHRGWKVESVKIQGHSRNKTVAVTFDDISPGFYGGGGVQCQLTGDQKPVCSTNIPSDKTQAFRYAYEWAADVPPLLDAVPFNRMVCELCTDQYDAMWLHGTCNCPAAEMGTAFDAVGPHEFSEGFPKRCPYIAEQLMTKQDRVDEINEKLAERIK